MVWPGNDPVLWTGLTPVQPKAQAWWLVR